MTCPDEISLITDDEDDDEMIGPVPRVVFLGDDEVPVRRGFLLGCVQPQTSSSSNDCDEPSGPDKRYQQQQRKTISQVKDKPSTKTNSTSSVSKSQLTNSSLIKQISSVNSKPLVRKAHVIPLPSKKTTATVSPLSKKLSINSLAKRKSINTLTKKKPLFNYVCLPKKDLPSKAPDKINLFKDTSHKRIAVAKNQHMSRMTNLVESIIAANEKKKDCDKPSTNDEKSSDPEKNTAMNQPSTSNSITSNGQPFKRPLPDTFCNDKKKVKPCDTDYDILKVIADKRKKHESVSTSPAKPLGPPPITVGRNTSVPVTKIVPTSNVLKNQISLLPKDVNSKSYSADPFLQRVLEWKVNWMRENRTIKNKPPPLSERPLTHLKTTYASIKDYCETYEPLILHEVWGHMMQAFESGQSGTNMFLSLFSFETSDNFMRLDCQATCSYKEFEDQKHIAEGEMVLAELPVEQNERKLVFGYIQELSTEEISDRSIIAPSLKVKPGHRLLLKYHVRTKLRIIKLDMSQMMRVTSFYYLRPMLRNVEAMYTLANSKLCDDILNPSQMACQMAIPSSIEVPENSHNESQYKAILAAVEAIMRPYPIPKMLLVQGPPGTGKTFTLIGMIKKIFLDWDDLTSLPKILVCTPSNGAVDEIARRLHSERHFLNNSPLNRSLRLVRLGQPSQIHPSVRKFCLDELVDSNVKNRKNELEKQHQSKITSLEEMAAEKDRQIADLRARNEKEKANQCSAEMYQIFRDIKLAKSELGRTDEGGGGEKKALKIDILRKADVILSTLNSCRNSLLEILSSTERDPIKFNCVIIDEASQCCEPEVLMPLMYTSISKMILIGDPMQLPATVVSPSAADFHYGRSLFERVFDRFGKYAEQSPVLMLDTQYRMHSDICRFPSKKFYDDRLKTPSSLDERPFPIKPYMIFDLRGTTENCSNPKNITNELEAEFVVNLYTAVREMIPKNRTVGIITPYQGQKRLLTTKLAKFKETAPDVNTIDGFQGQERDVIIISLVRDFSKKDSGIGFLTSSNRLNVALTRAKHSLLLCISDTSLVSNEIWKSLLEDAESRKLLFKTSCRSKKGFKDLIAR